MRVHVAFTPAEAAAAPLGVVVDVLRASSTFAQALASGYRRILCCAEIEEARRLRSEIDGSLVGGERDGVRIEGFDVGASPREFVEPRADADTLIMSTTNGTRTILAAAERCDEVILGSLLNLSAVAEEVRSRGDDVAILCAGFKGAFALDDAYCAGRIVALLGAERTDAAIAAELAGVVVPRRAHGAARTHIRPARARGGHPVLLARERAAGRAAARGHGRAGGRDRRRERIGLPSAGRRRWRPGDGRDLAAARDAGRAARAGARRERRGRGAGGGGGAVRDRADVDRDRRRLLRAGLARRRARRARLGRAGACVRRAGAGRADRPAVGHGAGRGRRLGGVLGALRTARPRRVPRGCDRRRRAGVRGRAGDGCAVGGARRAARDAAARGGALRPA